MDSLTQKASELAAAHLAERHIAYDYERGTTDAAMARDGWSERRRSVNGHLETYWARDLGDGVVERRYVQDHLAGVRVHGICGVGTAASAGDASPSPATPARSNVAGAAAGPVEVLFSEKARSSLETLGSATAHTGLETGGTLVGRLVGDKILVEDALDTAFNREPRSVRTRTSSWRLDDTVIVGTWHSHPVGSGTEPSDHDYAGFEREFGRSTMPALVNVVVASDSRWKPPAISAFVTDGGGSRRAKGI